MILVVPSSDSALLEFNKCHSPAGLASGGQFCSEPGGSVYRRPHVVQVRSLDSAIRLIRQGRAVELPDTRAVNTLLDRLAKIAQDARARGEEAPNYDLCKVSVKGTNLFCAERVRTRSHPQGIPRIKMPQFTGLPVKGSPADKLPRDKHGQVEGSDAFHGYLLSLGIKTSNETVPGAKLKASQAELNGSKVASMMTKTGFDPHAERIFISRDNYVIDGHHRWAAVVGLDAADNKLGDITMKVVRIDAPIAEVLYIAQRWTKSYGIRGKAADAPSAVKYA